MVNRNEAMTADEWIDLMLKRASELRKAGITAIGCDGHTAALLPSEPEYSDPKAAAGPPIEEPPIDPLQDPATYADGLVPGFEIFDLDGTPRRR